MNALAISSMQDEVKALARERDAVILAHNYQVPEVQDVADYVLAPPSRDHRAAIDDAIARSLDAWPAIAAGDFERAMLLLHTRKDKP